MGDPEQLRARALDKLHAMGGKVQLREQYEGSDPSGSIVVTVDAKGFVRDVDIRKDWQSSVAADGFAAALFDAYTAGVQQILETTALAELARQEQERRAESERREAEREAARRGEQPAPVPRAAEAEGALPPEDDREFHAWVLDSLYRIGDEMYRVEKVERELASPPQESTITGPRGYLKVRHQKETILGVTGDGTRIRMAEAQQLRSEALEVFREAQHGGDR
ncbi:hypothetical protein [Allorhizocola rhizosphaerae]|uniref:hypothetical protein n=1 Tax=Allorhizocola rhizosphaerae TaxID=1872709 RepID=UPI0013C306F8|nr:hypothetical protein [Allorhizocola rhizosphaerae]